MRRSYNIICRSLPIYQYRFQTPIVWNHSGGRYDCRERSAGWWQSRLPESPSRWRDASGGRASQSGRRRLCSQTSRTELRWEGSWYSFFLGIAGRRRGSCHYGLGAVEADQVWPVEEDEPASGTKRYWRGRVTPTWEGVMIPSNAFQLSKKCCLFLQTNGIDISKDGHAARSDPSSLPASEG